MEKILEELKEYLQERDWVSKSPANLAKSVSIEAAEILEHFQWRDFTVAEIEADPAKFQELKMEIADVFIYLLQMVMIFNIRPEDIIREKLEYVKKKYPVNKIRGNSNEYNKIKKQYRKDRKS